MIPEILKNFLANHPDVEFIHYNFVDLAGLFKTRCFPKSQCLELATKGTPPTLGYLCTIGFCYTDALPKSFISSGWDTLYPDWTSLRSIEFQHASVICNISEENSGHADINTDDPYLRCPRSTLQRAVAFTKDHCGASFLSGFEIEFYLVDNEIAQEPWKFKQPPYGYLNCAWSLRGKYAECAYECVRQIQNAGIVVNLLHAIRGPQQFQIPIGPLPVVAAVDALCQAKEIIRRVAVRRNLNAIFLPKPFAELESCGLHSHLSLNPDLEKEGIRNFWEGIEDSFMAGILEKLPLITAFGMPCEASYKRVKPAAVGKYVAWGTGNRDTPIRRVTKNRWEFRAFDSIANPYLTLAAYIAAGALGILSRQPLKMKDTRETVDNLDEAKLKNIGIEKTMPTSFMEALDALEAERQNPDFHFVLGSKILDFYADVKRGELATMALMTDTEKEAMYFEFY